MSDNTALSTTRPLSTRQKTLSILFNSSIILALGAYCYKLNVTSLKFALSLFDDIVNTFETPTEKKPEKKDKIILKVIETPTEKKPEKKTE